MKTTSTKNGQAACKRDQLVHSRIRYEERARFIKALAHPTRLYVIDALGAGESCVQELHRLVDCDRTTLSKHLSVLRDAGVLITRKQGNCVYYSLRTACILGFFTCVEQALRTAATERYDAVKEQI